MRRGELAALGGLGLGVVSSELSTDAASVVGVVVKTGVPFTLL